MCARVASRADADNAWKVLAIQYRPDDRNSLCGENPIQDENGRAAQLADKCKGFIIPSHAAQNARMAGFVVSDEFSTILNPEREQELIDKFRAGAVEIALTKEGHKVIEYELEDDEEEIPDVAVVSDEQPIAKVKKQSVKRKGRKKLIFKDKVAQAEG